MSGEKPFVHHAQISRPELLDVVDDEWMQDKLPDDDIPLPEGITPPTEEYDEMREEGGNALSKPARWTELGLASIH